MSAPPVKLAVIGMAALALVVASLGIAHVARRQQVIQLGYQLARATEALAEHQEENRRLRLEKSILTNPERIRRLAESLGLARPGPDQIRVIRVPARTMAQQDAPPGHPAGHASTRGARPRPGSHAHAQVPGAPAPAPPIP